MNDAWTIALTILAILLVERTVMLAATRTAGGIRWIRARPCLHPDRIALVRMPMGLVSVLFWIAGWQKAAILWFSFWMIADLSDSTIAKNCDHQTESSEWLDPLSDKCMYFPALILLGCVGVIPRSWAVVFLVTDSIGQFSRLFLAKKGSNYFGKVKVALVAVLLALVALDQLQSLWFVSETFVRLLTISCVLLAVLSFYCKIIPDLWYANSLTMAHFICGLAAIWNINHDHSLRGFILIFVGQFFDLFDGRLARKFGSTRHGAVFDDIADGTSFGLAIGFLIVRELGSGTPVLVLAGLYVACVVFRLYRFLLTNDELPRGIFQGMPSPGGAMLAGSSVLLFARALPALATGLVLLSSLLMVSNVRYRHLGHRIWPGLPSSIKLLSFTLLLVFVNMSIADKDYAGSFTLFCFTLACLYTIYGMDRGALTDRDAEAVPQANEGG